MYKPFILFLFFSINSFSQEFETTLYISNKQGRTDSVIFGLNHKATYGVDTIFGEKLLQLSDIDTNFFLCISSQPSGIFPITPNLSPKLPPTIVSKKNILPIDNSGQTFYFYLFSGDSVIDFKWKGMDFLKAGFPKSFLISSYPGGWFDAGGPPWFWLAEDTSNSWKSKYFNCVGCSNFIKILDTSTFHKQIYYKVFYISLKDYPVYYSAINMEENEGSFSFFPTPFNDFITIDVKTLMDFSIINQLGKTVFTGKLDKGSNKVFVPNLAKGFYYLNTNNEIKPKYYKLLKQ